MKQKMKQETKQVNVDKQVKKKVEQFNKLTNFYVVRARDILNEIVDLRKKQDPRYSKEDLYREEGLEPHQDRIKSLLRFDNINPRTMDLQEQGKITSSAVFLLAQLPRELTDTSSQNKIVDLIVDGTITERDLLSGEISISHKIGRETKKFEEEVVQRTLNYISAAFHSLKKYRNIFSNQEKYISLSNKIKELNKIVKEIKDEIKEM